MKLYPFQEEGVEWLQLEPRRYLADVMGLGKTVQALAGAERAGLGRLGVVAPAVLRERAEEWFEGATSAGRLLVAWSGTRSRGSTRTSLLAERVRPVCGAITLRMQKRAFGLRSL